MRIENEQKLDYSNVLIRPKRSTAGSRKEVELKRKFSFKYSNVNEEYDYTGIPIIASNMDGVVGRTLVNEGEVVSKGQRLLVLHSPEKIWVETNIRETDISRLKLGQLVKIEVDAYPDEQFEGMISRIGNAATSQFAILPKLNEAGSFTKVTQRLRVRIEIDQRQSMLRPGMMVEVFINANDSPFSKFLTD